MTDRNARICLRSAIWPAFFCLALTGCRGCRSNSADAYPANLNYSDREDWIVDQIPNQTPEESEKIGDMLTPIKNLNERGGRSYDPMSIPEPLRVELKSALKNLFGTPADPVINAEIESPITAENLQTGCQLFRRHCVQCHGLTGDGQGPTGAWISPHPRDFRQAVFKFVSTNGTGARKPTRADLNRTLNAGIPTTAMPAFSLLEQEDRERLIDYVIYLSLRGKVEFDILRKLAKGGEAALEGDLASEAGDILVRELKAWAATTNDLMPVNPPAYGDDTPEMGESIRRGHALFLDSKGGGCVSCHADYGRAGKPQYNVWGFRTAPANLTEHKRKGGATREDLYRRIRGGIGPSNMPAVVSLSEAQVWDLAHFIQALPNPGKLPEDVKKTIYAP